MARERLGAHCWGGSLFLLISGTRKGTPPNNTHAEARLPHGTEGRTTCRASWLPRVVKMWKTGNRRGNM
eukprot:4515748-Alexandrium_andersonii.AAC.1